MKTTQDCTIKVRSHRRLKVGSIGLSLLASLLATGCAIAPSTAFAEDPNLAQDMLDKKKSFEDSGWHTVFERYLELYRRGLFNKSPNGTTYEQTQSLVGSGKAAMAVQVIATKPPQVVP